MQTAGLTRTADGTKEKYLPGPMVRRVFAGPRYEFNRAASRLGESPA